MTMSDILTKDEITFYKESGYLVIKNLFSREKVDLAHHAINEILNNNDITNVAELEPRDTSVIRRIWAPTKRHQYFMEMATSNELLDVVEKLIGPNIIFHYSKLNMKGPKVGSIVEWHQDLSYYPHTNSDLVACLVYLDDATIDNGCLQVIPGSHKAGVLSHYVDNYFRGKFNVDNTNHKHNKVDYLEAPAGSVIFLHCLTLHSSAPNHSNKPRRTFLPAYRAADAYPIYYGPHASHNEPHTALLRGQPSNIARMEAGNIILPFAQNEFDSLFELQEGTHLKTKTNTKPSTGYFAEV
jgi:phytanoyl-CoA hydroxylase